MENSKKRDACKAAAAKEVEQGALLFTTLCIVGLPVEVYIQDGSVYSGVFHTGSFQNDCGIILKKARKIKKGKSPSTVSVGDLIDTLSISSEDIVQVIAKGVLLPLDATSASISLVSVFEDQVNACDANDGTRLGQAGDSESPDSQNKGKEKSQPFAKETGHDLQPSKPSSNGRIPSAKAPERFHTVTNADGKSRVKPAPIPAPIANLISEKPASVKASVAESTSFSSVIDVKPPSQNLVGLSPWQNLVPAKQTKEFKLNPEAKMFSPLHPNLRSGRPAAVSSTQIPNTYPTIQLAPAQPDIGPSPHAYAPSPPLHSKIISYSHLPAGNGNGNVVHPFLEPIVGRTQAGRFTGQYHSLQAGANYAPQNPQPFGVGCVAPRLYAPPVVHDIMYTTAPMPSVSPAHPLLPSIQVPFPKYQGVPAPQAVQYCVPLPLVSGGPPTYLMTNQISVLQPPSFPSGYPVSAPPAHLLYMAKYP